MTLSYCSRFALAGLVATLALGCAELEEDLDDLEGLEELEDEEGLEDLEDVDIGSSEHAVTRNGCVFVLGRPYKSGHSRCYSVYIKNDRVSGTCGGRGYLTQYEVDGSRVSLTHRWLADVYPHQRKTTLICSLPWIGWPYTMKFRSEGAMKVAGTWYDVGGYTAYLP